MANTNEYIDEAYHALLELSADDIKRLEYEAREKAIMDYNWQMKCARREGEREGEVRGIQQGIDSAKRIFQWDKQGKTLEEIAELCDMSVEKVKEILE